MKRTALFLAVAAGLTLSACTDQPVPEPSPSVTATPTVEPSASMPLPSDNALVDHLAGLLPQVPTADILTGSDAVEAFTQQVMAASQDTASEACSAPLTPPPSVAAHAVDDSLEEQTTVLTALGFDDAQTAEDFTTHLQEAVIACGIAAEDLIALTHHTDAAFDLRFETSAEATDTEASQTSVVIVRNAQWVYAAATTPAADVALALTFVDQLDEMLR